MPLFNPYALAAGGALAAVGGALYFQSTQIHHYHKLYNADEVTIGVLNDRITAMTVTQKTQTKTSDQTVTKVITLPPEVKTVIKTVHDTPLPEQCLTPNYPEDVLNAF